MEDLTWRTVDYTTSSYDFASMGYEESSYKNDVAKREEGDNGAVTKVNSKNKIEDIKGDQMKEEMEDYVEDIRGQEEMKRRKDT